MLDPRRLQLLRDVADTGTIAAAAMRAGCTAAAASQQLASLERDVGTPLLERSARSVRLTEAGRVLADHANRLLSALADAERAVHDVAGLRGGVLRAAAFATAGASFVIPALATFRRHHPRIDLSFTELESDEALPAIRAGEIDVAITHEYPPLSRPDLRGLKQLALHCEPLLLAVPEHLRSSEIGPVQLADYANTNWIAARTATGFQAVTEMACRAAGFEPQINSRAHSYQFALALVAAGFGVTIVPQLAVAPQRGITYLPIVRPSGLMRKIYVTTRVADRSPAVEHLTQCLTNALDKDRRRIQPTLQPAAVPTSQLR
ncbi:LysR substrate-binding domain-containing protein [Micromonospora sp. NPDC051227]|uniref:LysR substrate-binding domain-containing protein n=1 Tax=Micromonospora sp. NPDC051227 TaxID=3364285 RepID=UPI0037975431